MNFPDSLDRSSTRKDEMSDEPVRYEEALKMAAEHNARAMEAIEANPLILTVETGRSWIKSGGDDIQRLTVPHALLEETLHHFTSQLLMGQIDRLSIRIGS